MRKLILTIFLFILLLAVGHSEWEDRTPDTDIEKIVVDTVQYTDYDHWLDQVDRDSVQVIFREKHFTKVTGSNFIQSPHFDSVFYDTVRYYRK